MRKNNIKRKEIIMKIYRTINPKIIFILLGSIVVFGLLIAFLCEGDTSLLLDPKLYLIITSLSLNILWAGFGDAHLLYLSDETFGYKYFRSIPDAFNRFRSYCIKMNIIFAVLALLVLIPVIVSGFKGVMYIVTFAAFLLIFSFQNFAHSKLKMNSMAYLSIKGGMGGGIGAATISVATASAESELSTMPVVAGIITCSVAVLLAVISTILLYSRLEKKWNAD